MRKRFGRSSRNRDIRITVTQIATGRDAYENGRLRTSGFTTISFWGDVEDMRDTEGDIQYAEFKRLDSRVIKIMADSRSVSAVNVSDTLTLDNSTDVFEVIDIYDAKGAFKYTSEIIAKYKR